MNNDNRVLYTSLSDSGGSGLKSARKPAILNEVSLVFLSLSMQVP
jgi:hypothetical protein